MLDYTLAALNKTVTDLKRFAYFFNIGAQLFSVAYLVYAIVLRIGYIYANVALAAVTAAYTVFYIIAFRGGDNKKVRRAVKKAYNGIKLCIKGISLGIAIYGIYIATEHTTLVSIVMAALNIISWALQIVLTLTVGFAEARVSLIAEAVKLDAAKFTRPIESVGNLIKKARGEEIEPKEEPSKSTKKLDKLVLEYREKKQLKKLEAKAERSKRKSEAKRIVKEEKKAQKEKVTK